MTFKPAMMWRTAPVQLGLPALALLLSACQIVPTQPVPAPRLLVNAAADQGDQNVNVASARISSAASSPAITYTVGRTTLRQTLALPGRVVPARSAQLTFRGSGTVSAVHVTAGQTVKQGDGLADFAPDDETLRAARAQATLAELAYQSEQSKLDELQSGASKESVDQLLAVVQRDEADIQRLEQERAAAASAPGRAEHARATAKAAADRKVALAEVALQSAKDALDGAQAAATRTHDEAQAAQQRTKSERVQQQADAAAAASAAAAAVRAADRQVQQASLQLSQAKMEFAGTKADQALETQQFRVDMDKDALKDAQAALQAASGQSPSSDHTSRQIAAEVAAAAAAVKAAERALAADSLELRHVQANSASAKTTDVADVKLATLALEGAQEQLAAAQLADQRAQERVRSLVALSTTSTGSTSVQQATESAEAAVLQAQHNVQTAQINLDEVHAAVASPAVEGGEAKGGFVDKTLDAAKSQLAADRAKLEALRAGTPDLEIARQQTRVALLRDEATAASAAAQPLVSLKAPFDGTVADVGISAGQAIASGMPIGESGAATVAVVGQSAEGRVVAVRLVAAGPGSIVAEASESDVSQLNRGQTVDLTFPALPGVTASGTIVDVASTASTKDNSVSYPIRIDIQAVPPTLRFGMTAQVNMNLGEAKDALVAPRSAVRSVDGRSVVSKVGPDGQVHDAPVQVGGTFGTDVELLGGVQEGDVVAVYQGALAGAR